MNRRRDRQVAHDRHPRQRRPPGETVLGHSSPRARRAPAAAPSPGRPRRRRVAVVPATPQGGASLTACCFPTTRSVRIAAPESRHTSDRCFPTLRRRPASPPTASRPRSPIARSMASRASADGVTVAGGEAHVRQIQRRRIPRHDRGVLAHGDDVAADETRHFDGLVDRVAHPEEVPLVEPPLHLVRGERQGNGIEAHFGAGRGLHVEGAHHDRIRARRKVAQVPLALVIRQAAAPGSSDTRSSASIMWNSQATFSGGGSSSRCQYGGSS